MSTVGFEPTKTPTFYCDTCRGELDLFQENPRVYRYDGCMIFIAYTWSGRCEVCGTKKEWSAVFGGADLKKDPNTKIPDVAMVTEPWW